MKQKQIVVIGGGTGTSVVLTGLKTLPNVSLTAIVSVADSGGSTGRLRDEFGFLPVGDLRQALAALAHSEKQSWIRDILLYRFTKGSGLEGHNLGNLILTALQDMSGSTAKAIEITAQIFRLTGKIYPVTTRNVQLVIEYDDGQFIIGEHHLNPEQHGGKKIKRVRLSPHATLYRKAKTSLLTADLIIIGPGDLYASILPNLIVSGMRSTLQATHAKILYLVNLMTSYTQTHEMTAADHVSVIESAIKRPLDYIFLNNQPVPPKIALAYKKEHDLPVKDDLPRNQANIYRVPLIKPKWVKPEIGDMIGRSFLRHDPYKVAQMVDALL